MMARTNFESIRHTASCSQCNTVIGPLGGSDKLFVTGRCETCFNLITHNQLLAEIEEQFVAKDEDLAEQRRVNRDEFIRTVRFLNAGRESA